MAQTAIVFVLASAGASTAAATTLEACIAFGYFPHRWGVEMRRVVAGLILLVGLAAGAGLRSIWESSSPQSLSSSPAGAPAQSLSLDVVRDADSRSDSRLGELERSARRDREAIRGLESDIARLLDAGQGSPRVAATAAPEGSRDAAREALFERRSALISAFQLERPDPAWAEPMQRTLLSAFRDQPNRGSTASPRIECRSSQCIATFTWQNYKAAALGFESADILSESCTRFMLLDDPSDPEKEFSAQVIFTCKR